MRKAAKGQYFSFDAIIATVIVVMAMATLMTYWFSIQSVVDAKGGRLHSQARDVADALFSPGSPSNWQALVKADEPETLSEATQLGITNDYTNFINETKLVRLKEIAAADAETYLNVKKMFHSSGFGEELYMVVQQADDNSVIYQIGCDYSTGILPTAPVSEVAIVHRGGTLVFEDPDAAPVPVRVLVAAWRQNAKSQKECP